MKMVGHLGRRARTIMLVLGMASASLHSTQNRVASLQGGYSYSSIAGSGRLTRRMDTNAHARTQQEPRISSTISRIPLLGAPKTRSRPILRNAALTTAARAALVPTAPHTTTMMKSSNPPRLGRWWEELRGRRRTRSPELYLQSAIAGGMPDASQSPNSRPVYWKEGFYTNWTMGKLLENEQLEKGRKGDPIVVLNKSKNIAVKIARTLKNIFVGFAMLVLKPWRIPGATINLCKHIQHEIVHYSQGFRLFCADISTAAGLLKSFIRTGKLSWRERRQLSRAISDMFRLVPMAVFLLVPLFEFLLPIALKLFPEMLPSQFHKQDAREAQLKKELKVRLRTAAFLQETIKGIVKTRELKNENELVQLLDNVRQGRRVSNDNLLKVAHLFDDEIALDNLEHIQLSSICRMVGVSPIGPSPYLRKKLFKKLKELKKEDVEIAQLGVDSMNLDELMAACRERGMRTIGLTMEGYKRNLKSWLSLSLESDIPASLLLLSRSFTLLERNPNPEECIRDALKNVDTCVDELLFDAGVTQDLSKKIELIANQNKLIRSEKEQELEGPKILEMAEKKKAARAAATNTTTTSQEVSATGALAAATAAGAGAASSGKDVAAAPQVNAGEVAGAVLGKLELLESSQVSDSITEDELIRIAEELEGLMDDPFVSEREYLMNIMEKTDSSPEQATGRIRAAAARARAVADERPTVTVVSANEEEGRDMLVQIENAPFAIPDSKNEMAAAGIVLDEAAGGKAGGKEEASAAAESTEVPADDYDTVLERRLKFRLDSVIDKIEKRLEKVSSETEERAPTVAKLDENADGSVSQQEIVQVLTSTLVEFKDSPEAAERVAKTLASRYGNWAGEVSVSELMALAKQSREEEMGD